MRPGYIELEETNITVRENYGTLEVSVVRVGGTDGVIRLKYKTSDGTATLQSDFESAIGDLVFEDGESKKIISVVIVNDNEKELVETFQLQIYDISPGPDTINFKSLGSALTTFITIIDDDGKYFLHCCIFTQTKLARHITISIIFLPTLRLGVKTH